MGEAASADAAGAYPQSCAEAHDSSLCGGSLLGSRVCGRGEVLILSHALKRMTAPSAEGAKGDFASAEARRWLSDRPRHPFGLPLIGWYQR